MKIYGKRLFFLLGDAALLTFALVAAVWLRFDGGVPPDVWAQVPLVVLVSLGAKLPVFVRARLYVLSWSQVSLEDMVAVFRGVTLGTALFWIAVFALKRTALLAGFPRSALLIDYVVTLHAIGAFRMGRRVYHHFSRRAVSGGRSALIVGAGTAGEQLARSLQDTPDSGYAPAGFIDDDASKLGTVIYGLRVLGGRERLPAIIRERNIETVLIAMPSAQSRVIRNVVSAARETGVREIRIVPGLDRILNGRLSFTDLREVQVADLLGREVVQIDTVGVERWLRDRTVLVTGAGGSIGSELCRQIVRFRPKSMVLLDWDESALFWIEQELQRLGQPATAVIGDIRDDARMREVFQQVRPQVVFHAAAYKHVGLMERHLEDAVVTNILGTLAVAVASAGVEVEKFVLISTDKAVNPTSVMGVTKRVAEQVCLALNGLGVTRFLAVRFGNVLGSRGSVVPLFQESIRRGEAITIRGPNMRRYFMATSEAVLLVLQAGAMGRGGEIFVLEMGEPVRIIDLARELVRLSGLEPDKDVPMIFADPEPGEKESEDLLSAEEGTAATRHDRIFVARGATPADAGMLLAQISALNEMVRTHDLDGIVHTLRGLVPTYRPSDFLLTKLNAAPMG